MLLRATVVTQNIFCLEISSLQEEPKNVKMEKSK
jgi:hypothetical protein